MKGFIGYLLGLLNAIMFVVTVAVSVLLGTLVAVDDPEFANAMRNAIMKDTKGESK